MLDAFRKFLKSSDLYKSLTLIIGGLIPILLGAYYFNASEIGFAIAMGVFYNSPTNVAGSVRHRTIGMLVSIGLTVFATLCMGYASYALWILLPVLGILTFAISYLSIYGFRASLVSLAGMLAVTISFANSYIDIGLLEYTFWIGVGGVWYLLLSTILNFLNPKMYVEELLSDTMELTSKYLKIRAKLLVEKFNREDLQKELFEYQSELSEKHENLREVILTRRKKSGFSNRIRRKLLLFIELVDMLELAMSNPVDYEKIDSEFKNQQEYINLFADLIFEMAGQLDYISKVIIRDEKPKGNLEIRALLKKIRKQIDRCKEETKGNESRESFYILVNLFEYQVAQAQKIKAIERVLNLVTKNNKLSSKNNQEEARFLTPQDYGFQKLKENFSLKSSIFRHALRLSIAMIVGFSIGEFFDFQNSYWILLTLLVIMRPSYGLTKQRMIHRIIGTLAGAIFALCVVYFVEDAIVFGTLSALALVLGIALVQLNYGIFAFFITLHVIFLSAMYTDTIFEAVQYRVLDTALGAGLAILSNLFLFPSWEFMTIEESILKTLEANGSYLKQIDEKYHTKKPVSTAYKLSRKKAFLAMGDLNAAFQRMTQEPKSKQKHFSEIYEMVVLNNTFLNTLASLGTFIRTHKTTAVSSSVEIFVANIVDNLTNAISLLHNENRVSEHDSEAIEKATETLEKKYKRLSKNYDKIVVNSKSSHTSKEAISLEIQETKLVLEQLSYLFNLSKNTIEAIRVYKETSAGSVSGAN